MVKAWRLTVEDAHGQQHVADHDRAIVDLLVELAFECGNVSEHELSR